MLAALLLHPNACHPRQLQIVIVGYQVTVIGVIDWPRLLCCVVQCVNKLGTAHDNESMDEDGVPIFSPSDEKTLVPTSMA